MKFIVKIEFIENMVENETKKELYSLTEKSSKQYF